jgi:hypothetical protein
MRVPSQSATVDVSGFLARPASGQDKIIDDSLGEVGTVAGLAAEQDRQRSRGNRQRRDRHRVDADGEAMSPKSACAP